MNESRANDRLSLTWQTYVYNELDEMICHRGFVRYYYEL